MANTIDIVNCSHAIFLKYLEESNPIDQTFKDIYQQFNEKYINISKEIFRLNDSRSDILAKIKVAQQEYKRLFGHGLIKPVIDINDDEEIDKIAPEIKIPDKRGRKKADVKDTSVKDTSVKDIDVKDIDVKDIDVKDTEIKDTEIKDTEIKDTEIKDMNVKDTEIVNEINHELENIPKMKTKVNGEIKKIDKSDVIYQSEEKKIEQQTIINIEKVSAKPKTLANTTTKK